jgi:hypothetical protein
MSAQIFVPLKKHDRIEEISRYLDMLARPEIQVVFLTAYREKVSWFEIQLNAMQTGTKAITTTTTLAANASREIHLHWVEQRIRPARDALQKKGTSVVVQCYTGSLRNALASLHDADHEVVVLLSERGKLIRNFFGQIGKIFRRFRTGDLTPILFLRPRRQP